MASLQRILRMWEANWPTANSEKTIPVFFILNEFSELKKVHEGISKQIESSFDVPVLNSKIGSRVAYTEVSLMGQGVFEHSDLKAKSEMANLTKEILEKAKKLKLME